MNKETPQKPIHLELSFEEINLLLKSLGQLPFNEVYDLIGKIHEQANMQVQEPPS